MLWASRSSSRRDLWQVERRGLWVEKLELLDKPRLDPHKQRPLTIDQTTTTKRENRDFENIKVTKLTTLRINYNKKISMQLSKNNSSQNQSVAVHSLLCFITSYLDEIVRSNAAAIDWNVNRTSPRKGNVSLSPHYLGSPLLCWDDPK